MRIFLSILFWPRSWTLSPPLWVFLFKVIISVWRNFSRSTLIHLIQHIRIFALYVCVFVCDAKKPSASYYVFFLCKFYEFYIYFAPEIVHRRKVPYNTLLFSFYLWWNIKKFLNVNVVFLVSISYYLETQPLLLPSNTRISYWVCQFTILNIFPILMQRHSLLVWGIWCVCADGKLLNLEI